MRHSVAAACVLVAASVAAAQDFRQTAGEEPFTGAPLGVAFAKGGLGVSWGAGKTAFVFDVKTGAAKGEFAGHGSDVTAGAGCPGARLFATGDAAGVVSIWDPSNRREAIRIEARPSPVRWITWSPEGRFVAVVTEDNWLTAWRVADGSRLLEDELPPTGSADVLFSPDGDRLEFVERSREPRDGGVDSQIQINEADLAGGTRLRSREWKRHDESPDADPYAAARADARSRRFALADGDEVLVWAIDDQREVCRLNVGAEALAWRRDGKLMVAREHELALANTQTGRIEKRWPGIDGITWLAVGDDNRTAIGGGPAGGAVWKLNTSSSPEELPAASDVAAGKGVFVVRDSSGRGATIRMDDGSISPLDGDAPDPATGLPAISASFEDDSVLFVSEGRPVVHAPGGAADVPCGEAKAAPVIGVMCAGDSVAAWGATSWTLCDGAGKVLMRGPGRPVRAGGRWLAIRAGHALSVLDANAARSVAEFSACDAFDLAGDAIAVLGGGDALVVSLPRNKEIFRVAAARATDIALSGDEKRVAFDNGLLAIWDVKTARKLRSLSLRGPLASLKWHPGNGMLAALTTAGNFRLSAEDGTDVLGTDKAVVPDVGPSFAFSRDGAAMALVWNDGARFYDMSRDLHTEILRGTSGSPAFAPGGDRWILRDHRSLRVFEGSENIESLESNDSAFLPTGALAVADHAGVRIWDGRFRETITNEETTAVSASEDGKRIAAAAGTKLLIFEK